MRSNQTKKLLSRALGLIVLGLLCFWFAPSQLGGASTYVVTHGISMEPRFHTGDLAIVRSQGSYRVGEIVAYDNRMLHTVVLHRIIGRDGSRYVFKGDNNNFVDPEHPRASQLVGALWLHIPGVGAKLQSIRSPLLVGVLIAVGLLILTGSVFARGRRRQRRRERRAGEGVPVRSARLPRPSPTPAAGSTGIVVVGLVLLLPFIVLALVASTKAPTARHPYAIPYKQSGSLSYTAEAPPGPAYPEGRVTTGEPIFAHIVKAIDFRFAYRLQAADRRRLGGTIALDADVASSYGWRRTLALAPPIHFHGSRAVVSGTLNLTSLFALLHSVDKATTMSGGYSLTIVPRVTAAGTVGVLPIHTNFTAKAAFTLTPSEIESASTSSGSPSTSTEEKPAANPLAFSTPGTATGIRTAPETLTLGVATLSVATARTIARDAIVIIVCLLLVALACLRPVLALLARGPREESETIQARYGRMIVPVARVWQLPGVPVIDVEDMEALAQIAEHYDRSILHETADEGHAFWVADESGQFRYAVGEWASAATAEPASRLPLDTLVNEVYSDAFERPETIAAYGKLPAEETFAAGAVTQGDWTPRRQSGRGRARKPRLV